jgi:hypothetical protein
MAGSDWASQSYGEKHYSPAELKAVSLDIQKALQSGGSKRGYLGWTKEKLLQSAKKKGLKNVDKLPKAKLIALLRKTK